MCICAVFIETLEGYSWFSRDFTKILKSKPGGLQKFYLHLRKDYLKIYSYTIPYLDIVHSFENRRVSISEFSSCVTSEDGCGRAVPYLQNDSYGDFQHSKQCKYSWFSRDVTKILKSKPGGLQNFYLLLRKDYLKIYLFTIP